MNKLLEKFVPGGFALALLLLTGAGTASYLSIQKLIDNKLSVEHTHQVLEALDKTSEGLNDAERGRRGYIITGKKFYLQTYKTGIQTNQEAIQSLRKLTSDNPRQQERLNEVEPLIAKSLALLEKSVDLWQKNKLDMVTQVALTEEGRKSRETLEAKLNLMDLEERKLLQQRSDATDISVANTIFIGGISYFLSLSLVTGIYFLLKRQIRISQLAEIKLKKQAQMLDLANETIIMYDLEDRIIYWNQGAERLYGWTKQEAMGQKVHQLLQTAFLKPLKTIKTECLEQGYWDGKLKHSKRDRTSITVASRWTLERDEEGKPVAILEINNDITKREQAEKELRESEERWQVAVRGTTDGIWDLNIKTNQIYYSPRWKEMLGYEEDEISDRINEWIDRIHPEDLERVMEVYHQHLLKKIPYYAAEHRLRCKDSNYKWILTRGLALWDEAGNPIRISGSHSDISDRKQREEALRISQERYALAVSSGKIGVWDWNIQTNEIYIDPTIKQGLGYTDWEIPDTLDNWYFLVHPEDREQAIAAMTKHLTGETDEYAIEHRRLHKDGSIRWFISRGIAFQDANHQPYRMTGTDSDITELKTTEIALQRSQTELSTLLENTPDVICRWDRQLRNLYVNTAIEGEIGITPQYFKGKTISEIGDYGGILEEWESAFQKCFETKERSLIEFYYCTQGRNKFYQTRVVPEVSSNGDVESILTITRDITKLKEAELTLQNSKEELEISVQERTSELRGALAELKLKIRELQKTEEELKTVNRALMVKSEGDQALIRAKEEISLLENICETIVEVGGYRLAWVGYPQNDAEKKVLPIAKAGYEADYLRSVKITWDESEFGQGPTGIAIRTRKIALVQNVAIAPNYAPWREAVMQRGYGSSIALPLIWEEKAFGVLNIYAKQANAFDVEEVKLLAELADNLSFGIMALRTESDRKRAETSLRQSERRYATLAETVPVGIFRTDVQGNNLYHNERWCEITGLSVEESQGQGWVKGLYPDDRERVFAEWYRSLAENRLFRSEHRLQRPDNVITWVFVQSVAEKDADGELIGFVGTLTDITERKNMEQALKDARDELEIRVQIRTKELTEANLALEAEIIERREAEKKLEQLTNELKRSNHELEQFAYIASHDLQEPLRAVTGYTQLLAAEYEINLDDSAREYVSYIVDGALRMRQLIQDLLTYSRVGTRPQEFAPTDCNLVLRQAIDNLQVAIAESNASIAFESLPTVIADTTQLIQLLQLNK